MKNINTTIIDNAKSLQADNVRLKEQLAAYNGLSPDTVKEIYEALKAIRRRSTMDGMESEEELITYLNTIKAISIPAITKAEQELKEITFKPRKDDTRSI